MRNIIYLALFIFIMGCNSPREHDPCLQALEVVSAIEYGNGEIEYEVIGEVSATSKGASDLGSALEETLNLDKNTFTSCLIFEENNSEYFGFFILDVGVNIDNAKIRFDKKSKVKFRRIKLKKPILETYRKQKNVEYLYLVTEIQSLH